MSEESDNHALAIKVARLEEKLASSEGALVLAREALTRWQMASNEWRQENIDQRSQYLSIDKGQSMIAAESAFRYALEARVRILEQTSVETIGKSTGSYGILAAAATVITICISIAAIILRSK